MSSLVAGEVDKVDLDAVETMAKTRGWDVKHNVQKHYNAVNMYVKEGFLAVYKTGAVLINAKGTEREVEVMVQLVDDLVLQCLVPRTPGPGPPGS